MGHFFIAIAITAIGLVGARYGIGYPVQSRAPFGFFFSYVMVVFRMVVGVFWYGVNTYTGAQCIYAVLVAIWPSFATMENQLPVSANITTKMMICKWMTTRSGSFTTDNVQLTLRTSCSSFRFTTSILAR